MIKTLFASACVLACCIGNEYPAKAGCSDNSWGGRSYCELTRESGEAMQRNNKRMELEHRLHNIEQGIYSNKSTFY
tara:strand:+ start:102 stop:329 length:228 start_codon:yes stop_codon:yes gene_type:complete